MGQCQNFENIRYYSPEVEVVGNCTNPIVIIKYYECIECGISGGVKASDYVVFDSTINSWKVLSESEQEELLPFELLAKDYITSVSNHIMSLSTCGLSEIDGNAERYFQKLEALSKHKQATQPLKKAMIKAFQAKLTSISYPILIRWNYCSSWFFEDNL